MAELLGYAKKKAIAPLYAQIDEIEKQVSTKKSGSGWFAKIEKELRDLF